MGGGKSSAVPYRLHYIIKDCNPTSYGSVCSLLQSLQLFCGAGFIVYLLAFQPVTNICIALPIYHAPGDDGTVGVGVVCGGGVGLGGVVGYAVGVGLGVGAGVSSGVAVTSGVSVGAGVGVSSGVAVGLGVGVKSGVGVGRSGGFMLLFQVLCAIAYS